MDPGTPLSYRKAKRMSCRTGRGKTHSRQKEDPRRQSKLGAESSLHCGSRLGGDWNRGSWRPNGHRRQVFVLEASLCFQLPVDAETRQKKTHLCSKCPDSTSRRFTLHFTQRKSSGSYTCLPHPSTRSVSALTHALGYRSTSPWTFTSLLLTLFLRREDN